MKRRLNEAWTMLRDALAEMRAHGGDYVREAAEHNFRRYRLLVLFAFPVIVATMVAVCLTDPEGSAAVAAWRTAILIIDAVIAFTQILFYVLFVWVRRRKNGRLEILLQYVSVTCLVAMNALNTVAGQFISPNISVFIYACVLAGFVFYLRPSVSALVFTLNFIFIFLLLGLTQTNAVLLASARMNALTTVALGFFVSFTGWVNFIGRSKRIALVERQKVELERVNGELATIARHDRLSGLLNRGAMEDAIREAFYRPVNARQAIPLFILDLDEFKQVNDVYGHPAGDMLIRSVATILRTEVPATSLISRWGGDEFLVALPGRTFTEAKELAERLRDVLGSTGFAYDEHLIRTSVSIGVARIGDVFDRGYRDADNALYRAKNAGKNRVMTVDD